MLRLIFVSGLIAVGGFYALRGPLYAILFYLWIAYFRPETWVVISTGQNAILDSVSFVAGAWALISAVSHGSIRLGTGPILMLIFLAHASLSVMVSPIPGLDTVPLMGLIKTIAISIAIQGVIRTPSDLRLAILVMCCSLAFEGAKQGWLQLLLNPGAENINRLPMFGDNNGVALGMLMAVSLLISLIRTTTARPEQAGLAFLTVGVFYRAISTYSRGGFLTAIALGGHFLLTSSKRPLRSLLAVLAVMALIYPALPSRFWNRMDTIAISDDRSQMEESAASRLHLWEVGYRIAQDHPLTGTGVDGYVAVYDSYDNLKGHYGTARHAHSVWFALMADVGFVGLFLYIVLLLYAIRCCRVARRLGRTEPSGVLFGIAAGLEGTLIVFAVAGSFLSFQYAEVIWHMMAFSMVAARIAREHVSPVSTGAPTMGTTVRPLTIGAGPLAG